MTDATPATTGDPAPAILSVTSRDFVWTQSDGFRYQPGSERHEGLNRTREGALDRIDAHRGIADRRRHAFLATLFDDYERATMSTSSVTFEYGEHVVRGRRFHIKAVDVGA